ncbi:MAG TPA: hypothetical protein VE091_11870 [Gemmatimonadales bacterium]|nr:hypothetical protein [Gemmatimonadales bacterium]
MSVGGLSKARLGRMHDVMAGHVEHGEVPGIVTLVSRRGEVHVDAMGTKAVGGTDGPRGRGETERESARAGRRGLGASEARRARSARALDGPPGTPSLPLARRVAAELTCVEIELFLGAGW